MKKTIVILLILFSACALKTQTTTSPKIYIWFDEGKSDYTIPEKISNQNLYKWGQYENSFNSTTNSIFN